MKTRMILKSGLGLAMGGMAMLLGCADESKQLAQDVYSPAGGSTPVISVPAPAPEENDPATAAERPAPPPSAAVAAVDPERPELSAGLNDLVKLAESGFGDDVLIAHIQRSQVQYQPTADELIYLQDIGMSEVVITALVRKSGQPVESIPEYDADVETREQATLPAPSGEPAPVPEEPATTYETSPPPAPGAAESYANGPQSDPEASYFYESLSPYGTWFYVTDYGWCWRPTVVTVNASWRPYFHHGRWIYTDAGWYWRSHYSWGWAPFHYGRWYYHPIHSWCWVPGRVWGPAWVSWRYSSSYCGWAPLPPAAYYHSGVGFTYYGSRVGVSFGFGLGYHHYAFVPYSRFCDPFPYRFALAPRFVPHVYNQTTVINNYITGDNNTIINDGIGRDRIQRTTREEITQVAIRDLPVTPGTVAKPARLDRDGDTLLVYRPSLEAPKVAETKGPDARRAQEPRYADSGTANPSGLGAKNTPPPLKPASSMIPDSQAKARNPVLAATPRRPTATPSVPRTPGGSLAPTRREITPSNTAGPTAPSLPERKTPTVTQGRAQRTPLTRTPETPRPNPVNTVPVRPRSRSLIDVPTQPRRSESLPQPVRTVPSRKDTTPSASNPSIVRPQPVAPQAPGVRSAITFPQSSRTIINYNPPRPAFQPRTIPSPSFPQRPRTTPSFTPSQRNESRIQAPSNLPQPKSFNPAPRREPRTFAPPTRPSRAPAQPRREIRSIRPEPRSTPSISRAAPAPKAVTRSPRISSPSRPRSAPPAVSRGRRDR